MPVRKKTQKRNDKIRLRFKVLYEVERKRLDDVYFELSEEFFLSERRIVQILADKV